MILLLWFVSVLCLTGVRCYAVDLTDVQQEVNHKHDRQQDRRVLDILRGISSLLESRKDELATRVSQDDFHTLRSRGSVSPRSSVHHLENKRGSADMSVLPPWNEFCRMVGLKQCFHSRY